MNTEKEIFCAECGTMMKPKGAKVSGIDIKTTQPGSGTGTTTTTSIPDDMKASSLEGFPEDRTRVKFLTYFCEQCGEERLVEI